MCVRFWVERFWFGLEGRVDWHSFGLTGELTSTTACFGRGFDMFREGQGPISTGVPTYRSSELDLGS